MELPLEQLRDIIGTLREGQVAEFEYETESHRLRIVLTGVHAAPVVTANATVPVVASPPASAPTAAAVANNEEGVTVVTSPFVGTFYRAPNPDAPPFVEVGARVKPGQSLCIVEAMKLMNEIECEVSGTVLEVLVENATSVEFGQALFRIRRS